MMRVLVHTGKNDEVIKSRMLSRLKLTDKKRKKSTKKYESKQEVKDRRRKYMKEYRSRPEIKERQNAYYRQQYQKNKNNT